jgi:hypothetical protein
MQMLMLRLEDGSGYCNIQLYFEDEWMKVCEVNSYVKVGAIAKCGGPVYRPEIKITGNSVVQVTDFNDITHHMLQCMKTENASDL